MGTHIRIALYARDAETAKAAADAAFAVVSDAEEALTSWRADSEWQRVRDEHPGRPAEVSYHLWACVSAAESLRQQTDGVVDITIAPLIRLWRKARETGRLPSAEAVGRARAVNPMNRAQTTGVVSNRFHQVVIEKEADLDFGAVGKGHAVDEAGHVLRDRGISAFLIDFGGDMCAGEAPPGTHAWRVRVPGWAEPVTLVKACLASSGDSQQHVVIDGVRYSHIVDPRTGLGVTHGYEVTVISSLGAYADGIATALSILGTENERALRGGKLWTALIAKDGAVVWKSPTWPELDLKRE